MNTKLGLNNIVRLKEELKFIQNLGILRSNFHISHLKLFC